MLSRCHKNEWLRISANVMLFSGDDNVDVDVVY